MIGFINSRRSARKWTEQPVSEADILEIAEAGMNAPSAGNEQAWQMIVLTDRVVMAGYAEFNRNVAFIKNAPAAILICGDIKAQKYPGYYVHDCCAATENILLAVHAKGMAGVWGNVFPEMADDIRKLLGLPDHIIPFSVVPFGYPDKPAAYVSRFDQAKLHFNKW